VTQQAQCTAAALPITKRGEQTREKAQGKRQKHKVAATAAPLSPQAQSTRPKGRAQCKKEAKRQKGNEKAEAVTTMAGAGMQGGADEGGLPCIPDIRQRNLPRLLSLAAAGARLCTGSPAGGCWREAWANGLEGGVVLAARAEKGYAARASRSSIICPSGALFKVKA